MGQHETKQHLAIHHVLKHFFGLLYVHTTVLCTCNTYHVGDVSFLRVPVPGLHLIPRPVLDRCVDREGGERREKTFQAPLKDSLVCVLVQYEQ